MTNPMEESYCEDFLEEFGECKRDYPESCPNRDACIESVCGRCYFNGTCDHTKHPSSPANSENLTGCLSFTTREQMASAEFAGSHNTFFNGGNPNRW